MVFEVNTKCLAFHGPLLYEAKILKAHNGKSAVKKDEFSDLPVELTTKIAYFIHYKGWKSTWDEWVPEDRVLAWNEENIRTQRELKQAALALTKKKTTSSANANTNHTDSGSSGSTSNKRKERDETSTTTHSRSQKRGRGVEADTEKEVDYLKRPEIVINVPDSLKELLVDDWEFITKEHQVVTLPRKPNVVQILKRYQDESPKKKANSAEADIFDEVLSGIKIYFDRSLGNILLYRYERQQYLEILKTNADKSMSEIYGAEHLLRLFVSLPSLIAQTNMDQQSIAVLKEHLEDVLKFLHKHQAEFFLRTYSNTSPAYEAISINP
ncbi:MRG-domain-containing protein [Nadsonia fulvescens var. elongata DSM 6958]|uniref:Chromatin modification-related protein EAF3 n=1 Tax=Nadsonia fulvescens var. elongata DSM 6958 TaxID=857566 RepID=A0A1E3PNT4_9ASCO|nr:MRG-domain-containing protein [Nadsonia fulvescens var. elongata DSM 6958]